MPVVFEIIFLSVLAVTLLLAAIALVVLVAKTK